MRGLMETVDPKVLTVPMIETFIKQLTKNHNDKNIISKIQ